MVTMIELKEVSKYYYLTENNKVQALNNINLKINDGEFISIIGKSGCGKSTLLNIISCMDSNYVGDYYLFEEKINNKKRKDLAAIRNKNFGFIFQNFNLLNKLSAYENIEIPLIYKKVPKASRKKIIMDVTKDLGIENRIYHKPKELSGGEQQRVAIARAICKNPKLLLCDEPTGALDYKTGKQILKLLQDTCRLEHMTVVIITHNSAISPMADKVIKFKNGSVSDIIINEKPMDIKDIEW